MLLIIDLINQNLIILYYIYSLMQHRYESQPFQVVRQINNFSPMNQSLTALRDRTDFNNIPMNCSKNENKLVDMK